MEGLPSKLRNYIVRVCIVASVLLIYLFYVYDIRSWKEIMFFALLSIIAETFTIPMPNGGAVSVGFAISLSAIIIDGPLAGALATAFGFLFRFPKVKDRGYVHLFNYPFYKTAFNVAQGIIMTGIAGVFYFLVGGEIVDSSLNIYPLPIIVLVITYLSINTSLFSELFSIISSQSFIKTWAQNVKGTVLSSLSVGVLGIIIALSYTAYGAFVVLLFFAPLLLARYSFKLYLDMKKVNFETIKALNKAVEVKDPYTSGHASRVGEYAIKLAQALKLPDNRIEKIRIAAILHDIGKIGISDSILNKTGVLTDDEYEAIKQHPLIGAQIVDNVDFLRDVTEIIKYHHERYDGKGYPEGIDGENIPMEAAILSIADVYDAMTSDRPYRKALPVEKALTEIEKNAGTQFHPEIACTFINIVKEEEKKEILAHVN